MGEVQNAAIYRRFIEEVFNGGNLEVVGELVHDDYVDHAALPGQAPGPAGGRQKLALLRSAFPDLQLTIEDLFATGDKTVCRWTLRATQQGELMGIPATGKPIEITGIDIIRYEDDRVAEHWAQMDMLGMLQQLGVLPAAS